MSEYITPGTVFPNYYQFPEFLLRVPISQTGKLVYMILYDRARLSKKNEWVSDGKIYTVYPIAELGKTIGKSDSTIKSALNELDEAGLLQRKSGGFAKANILYVLLPTDGQFSDAVKKSHSAGRKNCPDEGENSGLTEDSFPPPNKVIETSKNNQLKEVKPCYAYGHYQNIYLCPSEYEGLLKEFPDIDLVIEEMSAWCAANGKSYRNYEAALRSWAVKDTGQKKITGMNAGDYSFHEGESL